jgi:hypothetical protein
MRYVAIVDTETTSLNRAAKAFSTCLVYDFGYVISDTKGNIVVKRSFINDDVFSNPSLMETAYYAEKLPMYHENKGNEWIHSTTLEMWNIFNNDIKEYGVKAGDVFAYNAGFDMRALNFTINHFSNGFVKEFIPCNMWRDIWVIAGKAITATNKYVNFCIDNGLLSEKKNPSTSAETVFKYLTGNIEFAERHTALNDSEIEHFILMNCFKRHAAMPATLGQGWVYAARIKKGM